MKTGAEGVFCAALTQEGLGIAVKCDDGGGRASEAIIAAVLARLLRLPAGDAFLRRARPDVLTVRGVPAGVIRPSEAFGPFLDGL